MKAADYIDKVKEDRAHLRLENEKLRAFIADLQSEETLKEIRNVVNTALKKYAGLTIFKHHEQAIARAAIAVIVGRMGG